LTPCTAFCATASTALDVAMFADHLTQGKKLDAALALAPGALGALVSKASRGTKLVSAAEAAKRGAAMNVLTNITIAKSDED
jgi:hypothetical protein